MASVPCSHPVTIKYSVIGACTYEWLYGRVRHPRSCAACRFADSAEASRVKMTAEPPHSSVKMRAMSQVPVISPEDDLAAVLLQVLFMILLMF